MTILDLDLCVESNSAHDTALLLDLKLHPFELDKSRKLATSKQSLWWQPKTKQHFPDMIQAYF